MLTVGEKFRYQLVALSFEASYLGRKNMVEGFSDTINKSVKKVGRVFNTPPCNVKVDTRLTKPFSQLFVCELGGMFCLFLLAILLNTFSSNNAVIMNKRKNTGKCKRCI